MKLRLSQGEIEIIVKLCLAIDPQAIIYLYGSRIDPTAKGGDIDLLVLSESLNFSQKLDLLSALKEQLGEQKIDLTILSQKKLTSDVFFQEVPKVRLS